MRAISSYKIWCFDLDGTLVDQQARYTQVYYDLIVRLGGTPVSDYWKRRRAGQTESDVFAQSGLSLSTLPTYDRMREENLENVNYLNLDRPFPTSHKLLEFLNNIGVKVWIVSHRWSPDRLSEQLTSLRLDKLLTGSICTKQNYHVGDTSPLALSSEGARIAFRAKAKALQKVGNPSQTVMIGDSPSDIIAARLAQVGSIAIPTGCHPQEILEKEAPDLLCSSLHDLLLKISNLTA